MTGPDDLRPPTLPEEPDPDSFEAFLGRTRAYSGDDLDPPFEPLDLDGD
jgi:hypothetical protein